MTKPSLASRSKPFAIRREGQRQDPARHALGELIKIGNIVVLLYNDIFDRGDTGIERAQRLAGGRVPQPNVGVLSIALAMLLPSGRVGHGINGPGVPGERQ